MPSRPNTAQKRLKRDPSAEPARRDRPAGVGHADRAHRHPACLRREPAPCAGAEHGLALQGAAGRAGRHQPDPVQHGHLPDRLVLPRPQPGATVGRTGGDAGGGRGHQPDGGGVLVRPVVAVAAADLPRRGAVHHARQDHGRPPRPGGDRPGADPAVAAVDHPAHPPADRIAGRARAARGPAQRGPARHRGRRCADRAVLLQPGHRAADGHAGRLGHGADHGGARPGARRQHRQRRAGGAVDGQQPGRGTAAADRQPGLQAGRLPADAAAAGPGACRIAAVGADGAAAGGDLPPGFQHPPGRELHRLDRCLGACARALDQSAQGHGHGTPGAPGPVGPDHTLAGHQLCGARGAAPGRRGRDHAARHPAGDAAQRSRTR